LTEESKSHDKSKLLLIFASVSNLETSLDFLPQKNKKERREERKIEDFIIARNMVLVS
jgi:hypothetical protein